MKVYAITDIGRVRPINEDSFCLPQPGERFCAVADGMGGHNAGEVASALAVKTFSEEMRSSKKQGGSTLREAVEKANREVFRAAGRDDSRNGMGTTFTALCEDKKGVHIAHVGDSRAYLIRNGAILRVTMDHTLVEEMILQGLITVREAKVHPKRNYITRALGTAKDVEVDLIQLELRHGDVFLLCTDGLSNMLEDRTMLEILSAEGNWQEKTENLVRAALENGGPDNITAMVVTFEEEKDR